MFFWGKTPEQKKKEKEKEARDWKEFEDMMDETEIEYEDGDED